jgi:hypothetical protein
MLSARHVTVEEVGSCVTVLYVSRFDYALDVWLWLDIVWEFLVLVESLFAFVIVTD